MDPQDLGGGGSIVAAFLEEGSEQGRLGELQELLVEGGVGGLAWSRKARRAQAASRPWSSS